MSDVGEKTEEYERHLALKEGLTPSKAYLIDSGASNHMESFTTLTLSGGPSTHMGDVSQIPDFERVSIKIKHDNFIPSPAAKKNVQDEKESESSTQSIRIEESLLGVTPSSADPEV